MFLVLQHLPRVRVSAVVLSNLPSEGINKSSDSGADSTRVGAEEQQLPEGELLLQVGGQLEAAQADPGPGPEPSKR